MKGIKGTPATDTPILVTGCGRSGTLYISKVFQVLGYDVQHERWGEHGISSWYLLFPEQSNVILSHYSNFFVYHITRHPLNVISSFQKPVYRKSFTDPFLIRVCGMEKKDSHLVKCMKYWVRWNQFVRTTYRGAKQFRVENTKEFFATWKNSIKIDEVPTNTHSHKGKNRAKSYHYQYSWHDLVKEDEHLAGDVRSLASYYGYNEGVK